MKGAHLILGAYLRRYLKYRRCPSYERCLSRKVTPGKMVPTSRIYRVAGDGHGGISYFAGGFSNQYGLETQIVAAMCKIHPMILLSSMSMPQTEKLSNWNRWSSVIRHYLSGLEGAAYG